MCAFPFISFNPIRSIGIRGVSHIKPQYMFRHLPDIRAAQKLLFPEYWQVNSLVYGMIKPIFPSTATYHLGHDKVEMTRGFMAACPELTPKTGIYRSDTVSFDHIAETFGLPFVCKEIRNSSSLGVFLIASKAEFHDHCIRNEVLYVQEYLEIDRDLRVVIIGNQVVTAYWRIGPKSGFHNNVARGGRVSQADIPEFAVQKVAAAARAMNINYAGFDVAVTPAGIYLIEFNPGFGTRGIGLTSFELGKLIQDYLNETAERPGHSGMGQASA